MPVWGWVLIAVGSAVFLGIMALFLWPTGPDLAPILPWRPRTDAGLLRGIIQQV